MKIETAKNYQADKKDVNNFKTEPSLFNTSNQVNFNEPTSAPTSSAFAKILEETRNEEDKGKNNSMTAKNENPEKAAKNSKSESETKLDRQNAEKQKLEEKNSRHGGSGNHQKDDDEQSSLIVIPQLPLNAKNVSENSAPAAARQILHITDLERIISTVRTETFQNEKQVTISLKNSILEGLQIKLTITENGKLKAEFLALNEQIKKQLNLRKKELSEILRNRSGLFSEVEVKSQNTAEKG